MNKTFQGVPLSILDLVPVKKDGNAAESLQETADLAQHADRWGFNRYWVSEHHNNPGIVSSATSVVIGHIAGKTERIRVGSGGVMLPNHSSLVIAEQFGTLETLYPGRIDLGLGRAPGTDQTTAYALRRTRQERVEDFPMQVEELEAYFKGEARVHAYPGEGLDVPIWLLGSSDFSARLAAHKGLPFSFASHFLTGYTFPALRMYRENFQPSEVLAAPYTMLSINVIAADTEEKAKYLATSQQQQFLNMRRGLFGKLQPPISNPEEVWTPDELEAVESVLESGSTIVGDPDSVKARLQAFIQATKANELMIHSQIYHHRDRLRSYEILAEMMVPGT